MGRLLKEEVEMGTMRFEHAQHLMTKVQQQARRTRGNPAKGLTSSPLCMENNILPAVGQGSQEGKKLPQSINGV